MCEACVLCPLNSQAETPLYGGPPPYSNVDCPDSFRAARRLGETPPSIVDRFWIEGGDLRPPPQMSI